MAVEFIFWIVIVSLILLVLGFIVKEPLLVFVASMSIMVSGIVILNNEIKGQDNILTLGLGIVFICIGAYIFISGTLETIDYKIPSIK